MGNIHATTDGFGITTLWPEGEKFIIQRLPREQYPDENEWARIDYTSQDAAYEAFHYVKDREHYGRTL